MEERSKKSEVGKRKTKKSYSVVYPDSSESLVKKLEKWLAPVGGSFSVSEAVFGRMLEQELLLTSAEGFSFSLRGFDVGRVARAGVGAGIETSESWWEVEEARGWIGNERGGAQSVTGGGD